MNKTLAGRLAIVTGSSRGIGFAIATALAELGAKVVVTATTPDGATAAAEKIAAATGAETLGVQLAVADKDSVAAMVARAIEWGAVDGGLHVLVNNAGVSGAPCPFEAVEDVEAVYNEIYRVNVLGPMLVTKAALPHLRKAAQAEPGTARVINISSVAAGGGTPFVAVYSSSKAALQNWSQSIALELAPSAANPAGINVNIVAAGPFATDMFTKAPEAVQQSLLAAVPFGRPGKPEEVSGLIGLLAGPGGEYISGAVMNLDGAMGARF